MADDALLKKIRQVSESLFFQLILRRNPDIAALAERDRDAVALRVLEAQEAGARDVASVEAIFKGYRPGQLYTAPFVQPPPVVPANPPNVYTATKGTVLPFTLGRGTAGDPTTFSFDGVIGDSLMVTIDLSQLGDGFSLVLDLSGVTDACEMFFMRSDQSGNYDQVVAHYDRAPDQSWTLPWDLLSNYNTSYGSRVFRLVICHTGPLENAAGTLTVNCLVAPIFIENLGVAPNMGVFGMLQQLQIRGTSVEIAQFARLTQPANGITIDYKVDYADPSNGASVYLYDYDQQTGFPAEPQVVQPPPFGLSNIALVGPDGQVSNQKPFVMVTFDGKTPDGVSGYYKYKRGDLITIAHGQSSGLGIVDVQVGNTRPITFTDIAGKLSFQVPSDFPPGFNVTLFLSTVYQPEAVPPAIQFDYFLFLAPLEVVANPYLGAVSPSPVAQTGSSVTLTLTGTAFTNGMTGTINGVSYPVTYISATSATIAFPGTDFIGGQYLVVKLTNGLGASNERSTFYTQSVNITSLSKNTILRDGDSFVVNGTNLANLNAPGEFFIGTANPTSITPVGPGFTTANVVTGNLSSLAYGLVSVYASDEDGKTQSLTAMVWGRSTASTATNTTFILYGFWTGVTGVTLNGTSVGFSVAGSNLTLTVLAGMSTGLKTIVVTYSGGATYTFTDAITITNVAAPTVSSMSPTSGSTAGGTAVVISGSGFSAGVGAVSIGGQPVSSIGSFNNTTLNVVSGPRAAGTGLQATVTGPGGSGSGGTYAYIDPPVLVSTQNDVVERTAGGPLTIAGTGLLSATAAQLDGVTSLTRSGNTNSQITLTIPANIEPGLHYVTVTTSVGTSNRFYFESWSEFDQSFASLFTDYPAGSWPGSASSGFSGETQMNTNSGGFPAAGAALNGHVGALFNGAQHIADTLNFQSRYFGRDPHIISSGEMILSATGTPGTLNTGAPYNTCGGPWSNDSGTLGCVVHSGGISIYAYDAITLFGIATAPMSFNVPHLVQWEVTQRIVRVRVDGGQWYSADWVGNAAQPLLETRTMLLGKNYLTGFTGTIWHFATLLPLQNSAFYAKQLATLQTRYALSGLYSASTPTAEGTNGSVAIGDTLQVYGKGFANATKLEVQISGVWTDVPITAKNATCVSAVVPAGLTVTVQYNVRVTAPGGVSNLTSFECFNPTGIPGLVQWDRADLGMTAPGFTLQRWADQSGAGDTNRDWRTPTAALDQQRVRLADPQYGGKASVGPFNKNDGNADGKLEHFGAWSATFNASVANVITDMIVGHAAEAGNRYFTYEGEIDYQAFLRTINGVGAYLGGTPLFVPDSSGADTSPGAAERLSLPAGLLFSENTGQNAGTTIGADLIESFGNSTSGAATGYGDVKAFMGTYSGVNNAVAFGVEKIAQRITYANRGKLTAAEKRRLGQYLGNHYGRTYGVPDTGNRLLTPQDLGLRFWLRGLNVGRDAGTTWAPSRSRGRSGDNIGQGNSVGTMPQLSTGQARKIDTFDYAIFDGVDDYVTSSIAALGATRFFFQIMVRPRATTFPADPGTGNRYTVCSVMSAVDGAYVGLGFVADGVVANFYDGAQRDLKVTGTFEPDTWHLLSLWVEGGSIFLSVNGGAPVTATLTGGQINAGFSGTIRLGVTNPIATYCKMDVLEALGAPTRLHAIRRELHEYTRRMYPSTGLPAYFDVPEIYQFNVHVVLTSAGTTVNVTGQAFATGAGNTTFFLDGVSVGGSASSATAASFTMPAKAVGAYPVWAVVNGVRTNTLTLLVRSDCLLWLPANRATLATGRVAAVNDYSPLGSSLINLSQSTAANRPKYGARRLNGRPAVVYDATSAQSLASSARGVPLPQPLTCYFVAEWSAVGNMFLFDAIANDNRVAILDQGGAGPLYAFAGDSVYRGRLEVLPSKVVVACVIFNGTSTEVYIHDPVTQVPLAGGSSTTVGANGLKSLVVGQNFNGASPFYGAWGDIAFFNGIHDTTARTQVMGMLREKYKST